jgi:hypothetical protein
MFKGAPSAFTSCTFSIEMGRADLLFVSFLCLLVFILWDKRAGSACIRYRFLYFFNQQLTPEERGGLSKGVLLSAVLLLLVGR